MKLIEKDRRKLEHEEQRLIAEGKMPSLAAVRLAIAETRRKYAPLIRAARKMNEDVEN